MALASLIPSLQSWKRFRREGLTEEGQGEARYALFLTGAFALWAFVAVIAAILSNYANDVIIPTETLLLPMGISLFVAAWIAVNTEKKWSSWVTFTPSLLLLVVIPLYLEVVEVTAVRLTVVTLAVLLMVLVGARQSLQAPLIGGAIAGFVHGAIAVHEALPDLAVPWWVWLTIAGIILVAVASTYEARMKDAKRLAEHVRALR